MLIQNQFGLIQNLQTSPISQTSFLPWTFTARFLSCLSEAKKPKKRRALNKHRAQKNCQKQKQMQGLRNLAKKKKNWALTPNNGCPARPKIHSHSQIFKYGGSIFCLPHWPNTLRCQINEQAQLASGCNVQLLALTRAKKKTLQPLIESTRLFGTQEQGH